MSLSHLRTKIAVGYISSLIEDFFLRVVTPIGYEVTIVSFKDHHVLLQAIESADAVFLQWDGRSKTAHSIIESINSRNFQRPKYIYAMTTSQIPIDILNHKTSKQLRIEKWFELPTNKDRLLEELESFIPDSHGEPWSEINRSGLTFLSSLKLDFNNGKHLLRSVSEQWSLREERSQTVTLNPDETLRKHITVFHEDMARTNDFKLFLTESKFKYHDEFQDVLECIRWIRGHGTQAVIAWYDRSSQQTEKLLRLLIESRNIPRIPTLVICPTEADIEKFQSQCGDLWVDRCILHDRNREKFRSLLIEILTDYPTDHSPRRLLDELRNTSLDMPIDQGQGLSLVEMNTACDFVRSIPALKYWADAEHLLGLARLHKKDDFFDELTSFERRYSTFDAKLTALTAKILIDRHDMPVQTTQFIRSLIQFDFLHVDQLWRLGHLLAKAQAVDALKALLIYWWSNQDRFVIDHEFYYVASRWAYLSKLFAAERAFIHQALHLAPLRNEYLEAYAKHLVACGHGETLLTASSFYLDNPRFSSRRSLLLKFHTYLTLHKWDRASMVFSQFQGLWPKDPIVASMATRLRELTLEHDDSIHRG